MCGENCSPHGMLRMKRSKEVVMRRILFQGDSITDAGRKDRDNPNTLGEGYVHMVNSDLTSQEYDVKILNAGIGGNTILNLLARWKKDCINLQPDILTIYVGINDCWRNYYEQPSGVEVELYEKAYRIILEEVKNKLPATKVIIMGSHVCHGWETDAIYEELSEGIAVNRAIAKKLAEEYEHAYIDVQDIFDEAHTKAPAEHWTVDGIHPTPAGHRLIANAWIKVYKEIRDKV